jgi:hypothetical protein
MQDLRTDDTTGPAAALLGPQASPTAALSGPAASLGPAAARSAAESDPQTARLVQSICRDVREQTFGGIRDLEVRIDDAGVVLRGRCASFYCKQLAQHAAIRHAGQRPLVNEIEVW